MTQSQFRQIALSLPEAVEGSHMDHPDFRVGGKIFAALYPRDGKTWGMLKLKPDQQRQMVKTNPETFAPIPGGWGKGGATQVCLAKAKAPAVRSAMIMA
ncbi:MAG: MmcQ/YjbR family DNA-binding protein [Planctomycetia bacterium]|jgi:predicted DNA-binding protein (MmcQ/YjbR family)|nr:MmcQ/YjbR family DNA-binding protein [Planctomycetia bacterium]MCC7313801.1 MmcQ/YjbR family DNA-binding protein [Planctomycetota bacterium]